MIFPFYVFLTVDCFSSLFFLHFVLKYNQTKVSTEMSDSILVIELPKKLVSY